MATALCPLSPKESFHLYSDLRALFFSPAPPPTPKSRSASRSTTRAMLGKRSLKLRFFAASAGPAVPSDRTIPTIDDDAGAGVPPPPPAYSPPPSSPSTSSSRASPTCASPAYSPPSEFGEIAHSPTSTKADRDRYAPWLHGSTVA